MGKEGEDMAGNKEEHPMSAIDYENSIKQK